MSNKSEVKSFEEISIGSSHICVPLNSYDKVKRSHVNTIPEFNFETRHMGPII